MLLGPASTQYLVGARDVSWQVLAKGREFNKKYKSLKSQNFDGFSGFLTGSCEGAYLGVRN